MTAAFKRGAHVFIPWGLEASRKAVIVEVWGDPESPSQLRVELAPESEDEVSETLLLGPNVVSFTP